MKRKIDLKIPLFAPLQRTARSHWLQDVWCGWKAWSFFWSMVNPCLSGVCCRWPLWLGDIQVKMCSVLRHLKVSPWGSSPNWTSSLSFTRRRTWGWWPTCSTLCPWRKRTPSMRLKRTLVGREGEDGKGGQVPAGLCRSCLTVAHRSEEEYSSGMVAGEHGLQSQVWTRTHLSSVLPLWLWVTSTLWTTSFPLKRLGDNNTYQSLSVSQDQMTVIHSA